MRLEKLKMGAVGQFNTKQSLALTSILENNHAVSQMAINRLGSVNPYLESAFQFLAFCTRDSLFCIPLDLISDYVMQGLMGEDDVENCKYKNAIDATLRQCPLFLVPKSNVNVKQVAMKDVLPKDSEGIFVSQLPPKTDLLPEVGSGSMTAAIDVAKGGAYEKKRSESPDEEKESIKMAATFSSRPATQEKSVVGSCTSCGDQGHARRDCGEMKRGSRDAREVREQSRPGTQGESLISSCTSCGGQGHNRINCDTKKGARGYESEVRDLSRPATQGDPNRPLTRDGRPASKEHSVIDSVVSNCTNCGESGHKRTECDGIKRGSRDAREVGVMSREPTQEMSGSVMSPSHSVVSNCTNCGESGHKRTGCAAIKRGSRDAREVGVMSREPTQEMSGSVISPNQSNVSSCTNCGVTGHKRTECPDNKRGSRDAREVGVMSRPTTQQSKTPGMDVRSAPPTPDGTPRKELVETEKLDGVDDDNTQASAGEFKPLNSEPPPRVEAGEFKPLMSEPPAAESTPAAKMSGSIEKPGIDGRVSVGERLIETDIVEAAIYGEELISGTIPIKKTEGDILVKVEDNLRPFEDEVESLTFNEGVHQAFRKFARNMVMRTIKGGQSSSSADTQSQQKKLQLEQFVKATKVLLMCYDKVYSSKDPKDLAFKRMLGPQLAYFVNCMLSKFNFKNRVAVRALKFLADSQCLLGELVKAEETLETAQNIAFQCFHPTDLDLFDILRDRADVLCKFITVYKSSTFTS